MGTCGVEQRGWMEWGPNTSFPFPIPSSPSESEETEGLPRPISVVAHIHFPVWDLRMGRWKVKKSWVSR